MDCGVDAAMVNPDPLRWDLMIGLYRDLSEQVGLPLVVQDAQGNAPADDLVAAVNEAAAIACLKIECPATPHKMGIVREALDDALSGDREVTILGGSNGTLLIEELDRGSVGTMPHPAFIDAFKRVCEQHLGGNRGAAWDSYTSDILPVARLVQAAGMKGGSLWLHKHYVQACKHLRDRSLPDRNGCATTVGDGKNPDNRADFGGMYGEEAGMMGGGDHDATTATVDDDFTLA